jgi:SWI/SNF-related matrix-associated actin-dependent regulator of chromatin subfamily A member 5
MVDLQVDPTSESSSRIINQLHKILSPFVLKRTKAQAEKSLPPKKEIFLYVGMTET